MKYSRLLCPPTLILPLTDDSGSIPASPIIAPMIKRGEEEIKESEVAACLEFFLRKMVSGCAFDITFPASTKEYWATPQRLRSLLSESAKKRLRFVDKQNLTWRSVKKYFEPVIRDVAKSSRVATDKQKSEMHGARILDSIVWNFYLLVLARNQRADLVVSPSEVIEAIRQVSSLASLKQESLFRLAMVEGVFALFEKKEDMPTFRCVSNQNFSFTERIDEILEDAYLLEASYLRRFFSIEANIAATKRDLRKILRFISKNRPWAKGIVTIASQPYLPANPLAVAEKLLNVLPDLSTDVSAPVLLQPRDDLYGTSGFEIQASNTVFEGGRWSVTVRRLGKWYSVIP